MNIVLKCQCENGYEMIYMVNLIWLGYLYYVNIQSCAKIL